MSVCRNAVEARARLADTARVLTAARGGWRGAALARAAEGRPAPGFGDLIALPDWARWPAPDRARLARLVALAELAPRISRVVDGAVLGGLATLVGAPALDWAMRQGEGLDFLPPLAVAPASEAFDARGIALLAAALPSAIAGELGMLQDDPVPAPDLARQLTRTALEAFADLAPTMPAA